ncbi:LysB family phage lysis regulatory protein [Leclercia sp. W6]|nr:LysB family phage lysis regulatory protein [Leclercia sp. W6]
MSRALAVIAAVLLLLSALLGWQLSRTLKQVGEQKKTVAELGEKLSEKNSQLIAVNLVARANDNLQQQLQQTNDDLRVAAAGRQKQIQEVIREDEKTAGWAAEPLPDSIIRLQRRPSITGSAGYQSFLSKGDALHPDGKQPGQ